MKKRISHVFYLAVLVLPFTSGCDPFTSGGDGPGPDPAPVVLEDSDASSLSTESTISRFVPEDAFLAAYIDGRSLKAKFSEEFSYLLESQEKYLVDSGITTKPADDILLVATVDVREIESYGKYYDVPEYNHAVYFHCPSRIDHEKLAATLMPGVKIEHHDGLSFYLNQESRLCLCVIDDSSIVLGSLITVLRMASHEAKPTALGDSLIKSIVEKEAAAVFSMGPLQEHVSNSLRFDPLLPEFGYLGAIVQDVSQAVLTVQYTDQVEMTLTVTARNSESIPAVVTSLRSSTQGLERWLQVANKDLGNQLLPPQVGPARKGMETLLAGLGKVEISQDKDQVVMEIRGNEVLAIKDAFIIPVMQSASQIVNALRRRSHVAQLHFGVDSYRTRGNKLPFDPIRDKTGKPLLSWRVRILPWLEGASIYDEFHLDEPWDSPHNKGLIKHVPKVYQSPGRNLGFRTPFLIPRGRGAVGDILGETPSFNDVLDDHSSTILFVEADDEHSVIWTKPEEFPYDPKNPTAGLYADCPFGYHVACIGWENRGYLARDTSAETWRAMFSINGGERTFARAKKELGFPSPLLMRVSQLQQKSLEKMRRISYAIDSNGGLDRLPATANYDTNGSPLLSWRVHLLPDLGLRGLYSKFRLDEPWDSEHNRKLIDEIPPVFVRPSRDVDGKTNYVLPVGEGTLYSDPKGLPENVQLPANGGDGYSSTIQLVEIDDAHAVIWTKPADLKYDPQNPRRGLRENYPNGFLAVGSGWTLIRNEISDDIVRAMMTYNGGEKIPRSALDRFPSKARDKPRRGSSATQR